MPVLKTRVRYYINPKMLDRPCSLAERAVAQQAAKDTAPFVPRRSGALASETKVVGNRIIYDTEYAGELFRGKLAVDPVTKIAGFPVGGGEFRSRRGIKKVLSQRSMHYTNGTDHWFYKAKEKYFKRWMALAEKEVSKYASRK